MRKEPRKGYNTKRPCMTRAEVAAAPADAILTPEEVGLWLNVNPRQLGEGTEKNKRLNVPSIPLGHKTVRFLKADVLQWIEAQRPGPRLHTRKAS